jgi:hypothetical protein
MRNSEGKLASSGKRKAVDDRCPSSYSAQVTNSSSSAAGARSEVAPPVNAGQELTHLCRTRTAVAGQFYTGAGVTYQIRGIRGPLHSGMSYSSVGRGRLTSR